MMSIWKILTTTTVLLVGFALGSILGRRWRGSFADAVLSAIFGITILLVVLILSDYFRRRMSRRAESRSAQEPRPVEVEALAGHLVMSNRDGRWVLRVQHLGRLEFFEVALSTPRWWPVGPLASGEGAAVPLLQRSETWALGLFVLSLGVYAITRLFAIDQFPIYFFTDEAVHPVLAADLLRDGLRDRQGRLFPTYFPNGLYWNLSLSVYLHALTMTLFGKSILVTRATSAIVSLFGAVAVGLMLKLFFKTRWWWIVVLFLTLTPAWFLHSRTAFETVLMVSFYSWFLLCYLLYRHRDPMYLFPTLIFGAATFYSYSNGQAVMAISGVLLFLSDLRYHLRHWRIGLLGAAMLVLFVLPYLRFRQQHPDALVSQLRILDSYWLKGIPLAEKAGRLVANYAYGLSPQYWFLPNERDLARHRMKDYGNMAVWLMPFFVVGLAVCLRRVKSSAHRVLLVAMLAAPAGSALAEIAITRALLFIVPANLMAVLGLEALVSFIKSERAKWAIAAASFVLLTGASLWMLRDVLVNGPTWYRNYGLYGMQWGARQLFAEALPAYMQSNRNGRIYISSTWANGTDVFLRFFDIDQRRIQMFNVDFFLAYERELRPEDVLVMTAEEVDRAKASGKFKEFTVERMIPYPDGSRGFSFAHLEYVDHIKAIFAAEREARRQLVQEVVRLDGEDVRISHSIFDGGRIQDLFDGDEFTLARGLEANPLILEFAFPQPREVRGAAATFGKMDFKWTFQLYAPDSDQPIEYSAEHLGLPPEPHAEIKFDRGPAVVSKIRLEILDLLPTEPTHIHIRELAFD